MRVAPAGASEILYHGTHGCRRGLPYAAATAAEIAARQPRSRRNMVAHGAKEPDFLRIPAGYGDSSRDVFVLIRDIRVIRVPAGRAEVNHSATSAPLREVL